SKFIEIQDWDAIDEAIGKRACEAFEAVDGFDEYFSSTRYFNQGEYTTTKTLVKMADGRYALQCQAYVFLATKEDQNIGKIDSVLLLVYLE
ncbi:MAG: hypothetical protein IJX27_08790, partial [Clostridia bacterium]|nr:hypothetical protein [Clostridia bacterium]